MAGSRPRARHVWPPALAATIAITLTVSACATASRADHRDVVRPTHSPVPDVDPQAVLAAFDSADSSASSSGSTSALAASEIDPQLGISLAAVRRNRLTGARQPAFHHLDPVFSVRRDGKCLLASATLWTGTAELGAPDVSEFVRSGPTGAWRISANIQISRQAQLDLRSMSPVASTPATSLASGRLDAVATELFARSIGSSHRTAVVSGSSLLDNQFAAGWRVYVQSLARNKVAAVRTLGASSWSSCATLAGGRTVAFLTVHVADTLRAAAGSRVTLPASSPDLQGLGRTAAVTGSAVVIRRVQIYLVSIPATGPSTLLGVSDAPVSLSVTAAR